MEPRDPAAALHQRFPTGRAVTTRSSSRPRYISGVTSGSSPSVILGSAGSNRRTYTLPSAITLLPLYIDGLDMQPLTDAPDHDVYRTGRELKAIGDQRSDALAAAARTPRMI